MNRNLLKTAYELIWDAAGRKDTEARLLKMFPDERPEDVAAAVLMMSSLSDHAYNVALDIRDNPVSMSNA